jgi:restriction system protein
MARAKTGLFDVLCDVFEAVFTYIHPLWSFPAAALLCVGTQVWFARSLQTPEVQLFGKALGGLAALAVLVGGAAGWRQRQRRTSFLRQKLDIQWLNSLTWQDFERQIADYYREHGFHVDHVGGNGPDGGVDLRLFSQSAVSLVQCKHWRTSKVGVKPVRELFGVLCAEGANRAILISSGVYTNEALRFARGKPIDLVNGVQLADMLRMTQAALRVRDKSFASKSFSEDPVR